MKTKNIISLLTVILSFNIVSGIVVGQTGTGTVPPEKVQFTYKK